MHWSIYSVSLKSLEECVAEGNQTVEQLAEEVAVLKEEKRQRKPGTSSITTSSSITTTTTTTSSSSKTHETKTDLDSFINENLIELQSNTNTSPPPTTSNLSDDNDDETYASQEIA